VGGVFLARYAIPQLLAWAVDGLARDAVADPNSGEPWSYVNVHCLGGPNRWGFDQWLKAKASDPIQPNPHVATALSGGELTYATFSASGVELPHLFHFDVATGSGGRRPMQDLLKHMAVLRGFSTGADGHSTNHAKQTQPLPGGVSLGGLVADAFARSVAAIGVGVTGMDVGIGYRSGRGLAQTRLQNPSALARELMTPFDGTTYALGEDFKSAKAHSSAALERAGAALLAHARARDPAAEALGTNMQGAISLIKKGVGNLDAYWQEATARYGAAIAGSVRPQTLYPNGIPGLTVDLASPGTWLVGDGTGRCGIACTDSTTRTVPPGYRLADVVANATVTFLPEYFALAEYALVNGLSGSIELPIGFVDGLQLSAATFGANGDEHGTGALAALVIDAMYYRALAAALLELISTLEARGLFERTLIHFTGDFSRSPHDGVSLHGSDHGFDACVTSLFAGAIQGPLLAGNVLGSAPQGYAGYPGSWGLAAPIKELGPSGVPGPGNVAATIATLMGISKHPWTITPPLLTLDNGRARVAVESPRTV
jgi:hypothetical protein